MPAHPQGAEERLLTVADVGGIFTIAGGTCTDAECSSTISGDHLVTGTDGSATGTATLTVTAGTADHLAFSVGYPSSTVAGVAHRRPIRSGVAPPSVRTPRPMTPRAPRPSSLSLRHLAHGLSPRQPVI